MSKKAIFGAVLLTLFLPFVALIVAGVVAGFKPERRSAMLWWGAVSAVVLVLWLLVGIGGGRANVYFGNNADQPTCTSWEKYGSGRWTCTDPMSPLFGTKR